MRKQTKGGGDSAPSPISDEANQDDGRGSSRPSTPDEAAIDAPKSLTEQRNDLSARLIEVQRELHALSVTERELTGSIERLNVQIDQETPPPRPGEVIQTYLESQKQIQRETPSGPSPLDQALAHKKGRGRPSFI